jgi:hypothetical protein
MLATIVKSLVSRVTDKPCRVLAVLTVSSSTMLAIIDRLPVLVQSRGDSHESLTSVPPRVTVTVCGGAGVIGRSRFCVEVWLERGIVNGVWHRDLL